MSARRWRLVDGCRCHVSLGKIFVKKWTTIGQPNWGTIWDMSCWEKFRWEIWDDIGQVEMVKISHDFLRESQVFALSPCAKTKFWRLLPLALLQPPWIRGSESDLHGFTPPAMGKHGNFQKDWGGKLTKVDQFTSKIWEWLSDVARWRQYLGNL